MGLQLRHYGLQFRMLPTSDQLQQIKQFIGNARFVFNFYLREKQEVYHNTKETLYYGEFKKAFNGLKDHPCFSWLKLSDKFSLECALEQVDDAFERFFNGQNKYPKFRSKHKSKQSYSTKETNGNIKLNFEHQMVQLPKLGWVKIKVSKRYKEACKKAEFTGRVKGATVTCHSGGAVHVSLKVEEIVPLCTPENVFSIPDDLIVGCDLGLKHFLIDSRGNKVENPRYLKTSLKRLASLQRKLKHKKLGSANYNKQKQKVAKFHLHVANMRKDFLHKQSRRLVDENQVIILEDLHVKGMIRNHKLARSIADVGWGMFKQFVTYKANWANKRVVFVDRFFPSSKLCHQCQEKHVMLSLSDRVWVCTNCGCRHDRDVNAAQNIKAEGIRILQESLQTAAVS